MDNQLGVIPARVQALRAKYAAKDERNREVQAARDGNFEAIAADLFSDQFPRPVVANLIDTTARDVAAVFAPLPSFSCSSANMGSDRGKSFADKRTKIVRHYLETSKFEWQMQDRGADNYNSYGLIVSTAVPDFSRKTPRILIESSIGAYPVWDSFGRCTEIARVYLRDWFSLVADYPHLAREREKYPYACDAGNKVEVVKYDNGKRIVAYIPKMGNCILDDFANPLGRCLTVASRRPGGSDEVRGAYDDVIWVQLARHRLSTLLIEGVDKAVRAPLVVPEDVNEVGLGPDSVVRTRNPQGVSRARIDMPAQAFGAVEQLKGEQQLGAMSPEARSGSIDASVVTGRGVQQLMAGFSSQIAAAQVIFKNHFEQVIELCFEMDEKLWPEDSKEVRGRDAGTPYAIRYSPRKDIDGDHTVDISYGFAAGLDPNRALVFLLQAQGAGLVSKETAQRQLPVDINPAEEERQIVTEQSRAALVAAFSGLAQSIPQLVAAGQDATQIIKAQAKFIELTQKGMSVEQAVLKVLEPPEPPPGASTPGPDQAATPGPGAESAPGGGPLGAPPAMPEGRPPLQMMMAGLTSRGTPNLQAAVSRQIPVQG